MIINCCVKYADLKTYMNLFRSPINYFVSPLSLMVDLQTNKSFCKESASILKVYVDTCCSLLVLVHGHFMFY